jgi:glyoxylase-like metal-dependent hydrolase (beta-lactamase superfamily II)
MAFAWTPASKRLVVLAVLIASGGLMMALASYLDRPAAPLAAARVVAPVAPKPAGTPKVADTPKPAPPTRVAEIRQIKDSLYVITGGGINTLAFVTARGVVLVDTKPDGWGQAILDKVKTVTSKPVTTIINTDASPDQTGSNAFFGATAEIVAQQNTRANMEKSGAFKGDRAVGLPKRTYADKMSLFEGKDLIELRYLGAGHTNGDTWVLFPALRVAYSGDMFPGKMPPAIDATNGGSAVALPQTLDRAASEIKDVDYFVTGRSSPMTPAELKEYAKFNKDYVSAVQKASKNGKNVDEIAGSWTLPDKYKGYTAQPARVKASVKAIVNELRPAATKPPKARPPSGE